MISLYMVVLLPHVCLICEGSCKDVKKQTSSSTGKNATSW